MDKEKRIARMKAISRFYDIFSETISWAITLDTTQVPRIYSTFSLMSVLRQGEKSGL
jgi:hypothetical protein